MKFNAKGSPLLCSPQIRAYVTRRGTEYGQDLCGRSFLRNFKMFQFMYKRREEHSELCQSSKSFLLLTTEGLEDLHKGARGDPAGAHTLCHVESL